MINILDMEHLKKLLTVQNKIVVETKNLLNKRLVLSIQNKPGEDQPSPGPTRTNSKRRICTWSKRPSYTACLNTLKEKSEVSELELELYHQKSSFIGTT